MKKQLKMIPYLLINAIAFYFLPMTIQDTGSAMVVVLIVFPVICFATSIVFGINNSINVFYPIFVALLFASTILIFYNESALVYMAVYGIIALLGNIIGMLFYKQEK